MLKRNIEDSISRHPYVSPWKSSGFSMVEKIGFTLIAVMAGATFTADIETFAKVIGGIVAAGAILGIILVIFQCVSIFRSGVGR